MGALIEIRNARDPRLDDFRVLRDAELLKRRGLFMAEGRFVVRRLLAGCAYQARAVLVTPAAAAALADVLPRGATPPVYVAPRAVMEPLTGFNLHRGCLATGERPAEVGVEALLADRPLRVMVLEGVTNPDNVGGLFRIAAAFGVGAVILDRASVDPLYRKAIRVSSGAALLVPFARGVDLSHVLAALRSSGYTILALTPDPQAETLERLRERLPAERPLALVLGSEGAGLSASSLAAADARIRIPINPVVDSLNVTVAAGIALHAFT